MGKILLLHFLTQRQGVKGVSQREWAGWNCDKQKKLPIGEAFFVL